MGNRIDAIYARQSVDRADSISIESQIEFCRYETRGEAYKEFKDKGYSGKNIDRPQFQEMMSAVRNNEIKRIICYKLDRCSRSILNFTEMMEELQKHNVEFVSCTEKFDTSTPMGRAMLNICIVFAQLERETIQQRVTDAYNSRSRRGFYMGGRVPFGYKLEPYIIDGKKTSKYVINPEEAELISLIYSLYSQPQTSYGDVVRYLIENGIKNINNPTGSWDKASIADMMKNPVYVKADLDVYNFFKNQGSVLYNPPEDYIGVNGCYLYADKEGRRKSLSLTGHHVVLAPHEGIIPSDIWLKARIKCLGNHQVAKPVKAKNTWLAGKVKCGKCGYAMVVRKSKTQAGRYFVCSRRSQTINGCEGVLGVYAYKLEDSVLDAMKERLKDFQTLSQNDSTQVLNPKINEINIKLIQVQNEIEELLNKFSKADDVLITYINKRITSLDSEKKKLQSELKELENLKHSENNTMKQLTNYMQHWDELLIEDKMTVVDSLISVIRVKENEVEIEWKF